MKQTPPQVEVMRATRMFLLQKKGPTRFVVRLKAPKITTCVV